MHPLASHGDEALAFEETKVIAELDGAQSERPRTGKRGQFEGLGGVFRSQLDSFRSILGFRHLTIPDHSEHGGFLFYLPTVGGGAGPIAAIEMLAGFAEWSQGHEVGTLSV